MKTRWAVLVILALGSSSSATYHKLGGFHPPHPVKDVAVTGSLAVVASSDDGVYILDVTDPAEPIILLNQPTPGPAWRATCAAGRAYVVDWWEGMHIFDLSDPTAPVYVGQGPPVNLVNAIAVEGNYAYLGGSSAMRVYNVAQPDSVTQIATVSVSDAIYALQKDGNRLYAAGSGAGLLIMNVTYPTAPYLAYTIPTNDRAYGARVVADIAYVADGWGGLLSIDISIPSQPVYLDRIDLPGCARSVEIVGKAAFVTDHACGLNTVDISEPSNLQRTGCFYTPGLADGFTLQDQRVFLADEYGGLVIADIAEPAAPFLVGAYRDAVQTNGLAVAGDDAYLADGEQGLILIDVEDPAAPQFLECVNVDGRETSLAIENTVAVCGTDYYAGGNVETYEILANRSLVHASSHVAGGAVMSIFLQHGICYAGIIEDDYCGIDCIDVSDPYLPQLLSRTEVTSFLEGISVSGEYVLTALHADGLRIYDYTTKTAPIEIASLETPGDAYAVATYDFIAYVADGPAGVQVIDWADPEHPKLLTTLAPRPNGDIRTKPAVQGTRLYIADDNWNSIHIYTLTDPANPTLIGEYCWNYASRHLSPVPDHLFVAHTYDGFSILDPEGAMGADADPARPRLAIRSVWPHPIAGAATVFLTIPEASAAIDLAMYDLSGRRVATLARTWLRGGDQRVGWSGRGDAGQALPAGTYYCRLRCGRDIISSKIVMIR